MLKSTLCKFYLSNFWMEGHSAINGSLVLSTFDMLNSQKHSQVERHRVVQNTPLILEQSFPNWGQLIHLYPPLSTLVIVYAKQFIFNLFNLYFWSLKPYLLFFSGKNHECSLSPPPLPSPITWHNENEYILYHIFPYFAIHKHSWKKTWPIKN